MIIGCPSEIKIQEYRVALIPAAVRALIADRHTVLIQSGAGLGSGITDDQYRKTGAQLIDDPASIWEQANLICKVKEPLASEYPFLKPKQILFAYLHLAANSELTDELLARQVSSVAFETIQVGNS